MSEQATAIVLDAETGFTVLDLDGLRVSLTRDDNGDVELHVSSEDAAESDTDGNLEPLLMVSLNDATIYDRRKSLDHALVVPATWNDEAEAYEV